MPSPQPQADTRDPLSILQEQASNLFLQSTSLQNLEVIGEGNIDLVHE